MRYFITLVLITAMIVLGVVLFGGNSKPSKDGTTSVKSLADMSSTVSKVRLTVDGRINGDDEHRQIVITIGRNNRTIRVIQGYEGRAIKTKSFRSNEKAYNIFLHALEHNGFTKERKTKITDDKGVCAQGHRFIYEVIDSDDDKRLWSTSCGGFGTFAGQPTVTRSLFIAQITGYEQIIASVNL